MSLLLLCVDRIQHAAMGGETRATSVRPRPNNTQWRTSAGQCSAARRTWLKRSKQETKGRRCTGVTALMSCQVDATVIAQEGGRFTALRRTRSISHLACMTRGARA